MPVPARPPPPIPTPTPTPTSPPELPALQRRLYGAGYSFTPLPASWTVPASCAGNTPTIVAGSCDLKNGCSAAPAASVPKALASGAQVNAPHYTTGGVMTSTACMPPGYIALKSFYYTSAAGCPGGFATAATSSYNRNLTVACCPTAYPSATWATGQGVFNCYDVKTVTPGQQFTVVARGQISESASDLNFWFSESLVGTTAWPTATTAYVLHPAVNLMYPAVETTRAGGAGGSGSDGAVEGGFSVFRLGVAGSVAVVIVLGVVGLGLLCCVGCCLYGVRAGRRAKAVAVVPSAMQQQQIQQPQYS